MDVVTHFAIWAVEVHSGRFDRRLLKLYDEPGTTWRITERKSRRGDETTPEEAADLDLIDKMSTRYSQLISDLNSGPFDKDTLACMLFDGDFNIEAIHRELDMSPLYLTAADLPSWQVLFYWRQYSNDEVNNAAERLSELFLSRTETDPGVLCHMFASKLWLAHSGLSGISLNDAKDQCISYIDDVEADLPASTQHYRGEYEHDGLGFPTKESQHSKEFEIVRTYMIDAGIRSFNSLLETRAMYVMFQLDFGIKEFRDSLSKTSPESFDDNRQPYLHFIDPAEFVDHWWAMLPGSRMDVIHVLKYRLRRIDDPDGLEQAWLDSLGAELENRCAGASTLDALRLRDLQDLLLTRRE